MNVAGEYGGAAASGGGVYNIGSLVIQNSTISDNEATGNWPCYGGGIYNSGSLSVANSSIALNYVGGHWAGWVTGGRGGGIWSSGSTTIEYTTIEENWAYSGGDYTSAEGGGIYTSGAMTISHSTISDNVSTSGGGSPYTFAYGGGIYVSGSHLTISNSTVFYNRAEVDFYGGGGGIYVAGSATITHSTIAENFEGIENVGSVTMRNSIVASNSYRDLTGTLASSGYNLIGNSNGGSGFVPSDILNVDPMLGPLADNGGPTLTMALLPGSPAIDSGTNQMAPEWDQRGPGFPRIVNGTIDRGAFEVQSTPAPTAPDYLAVLITANFKTDD